MQVHPWRSLCAAMKRNGAPLSVLLFEICLRFDLCWIAFREYKAAVGALSVTTLSTNPYSKRQVEGNLRDTRTVTFRRIEKGFYQAVVNGCRLIKKTTSRLPRQKPDKTTHYHDPVIQ